MGPLLVPVPVPVPAGWSRVPGVRACSRAEPSSATPGGSGGNHIWSNYSLLSPSGTVRLKIALEEVRREIKQVQNDNVQKRTVINGDLPV